MQISHPERAQFDRKLFEKELRSLHEVTQRGAMNPPQDLSYTVFVLLLLWLIVGVPFLIGVLLAFLVGR